MKTPPKENDCSVLRSWELWRLWAAWWLLELIRKNLWSKSCIRTAPLPSPPLPSPSPGRRGGGGGWSLTYRAYNVLLIPPSLKYFCSVPLYTLLAANDPPSIFPETHVTPTPILAKSPPPLGISNPDNKTSKRWALFTWLRGEFRTGTKEKWREHF